MRAFKTFLNAARGGHKPAKMQSERRQIKMKGKIAKAKHEAQSYNITLATFVECLDELNKHDEIAELMIGDKEDLMEDARNRYYYLLED